MVSDGTQAFDAADDAGGGAAPRADAGHGRDATAADLAIMSRHNLRAALAMLQTMESGSFLAARNEAVTALREAVRSQDAFLHAAAHDLRNPLAAIRGQAQLLRRRIDRLQAPEPEATRLLDGLASLDAAVERLAALIDRLLDASWQDEDPA